MADTLQLPASLMDYTEDDVAVFLASLGLDQYDEQIRKHGISGDVLQALDSESLKEIGINSVGQRLAILKAVYALKIRDGIPIEPDHYVPPSESEDPAANLTIGQLYMHLQQLENRIIVLEEENIRLQETVQMCVEDLTANTVRNGVKTDAPQKTLKKQPSLKWAPYKESRSPTKAEHESPTSSPHAPEHSIPPQKHSHSPEKPIVRKDTPPISATPSIPISNSSLSPAPQRGGASNSRPITDASDIRSFKVSLEDPAWKVLPAALKKYKINNEDWQNFAMFICYGNTERCLSYDEKPLLLFQKLKEAKKNPVFMLKHIRDIRSPIAVAQQKQAARRDKERQAQMNAGGVASALGRTSAGAAARGGNTLTVDGRTPPLATANLTNSPWPDVMSPINPDHGVSHHSHSPQTENSHGPSQPLATKSYAIAIYPYTAEQDDEFDVSINDTFIIISQAKGWWVVQKDPSGNGSGNGDGRSGWVPAGCLLETNLPVAVAIQEARANDPYSRSLDPDRAPIMPSSIVSTSYPGIALTDYRKKGEEELELVKDDALRVFKRYNHWSYAVKEHTGDRGWVPSWFIGKIGSSNSGVPPTPAPHATSMNTSSTLNDSELRYALDGPAASPVSPGFSAQQQSSQRGMI
ncbi:SubName: Full=Related to MAP kinase pathway-interacting protein {ECO:0000313/EMBL:CCA68748.1} [Serendipita indica DSM 11827]|nr:SubName: Full=Related to MAP kinase pathway-interacting protein {ECO:0000313/EMBL:CCA68748.1} [Serendipita indica DSM 11827]